MHYYRIGHYDGECFNGETLSHTKNYNNQQITNIIVDIVKNHIKPKSIITPNPTKSDFYSGKDVLSYMCEIFPLIINIMKKHYGFNSLTVNVNIVSNSYSELYKQDKVGTIERNIQDAINL